MEGSLNAEPILSGGGGGGDRRGARGRGVKVGGGGASESVLRKSKSKDRMTELEVRGILMWRELKTGQK